MWMWLACAESPGPPAQAGPAGFMHRARALPSLPSAVQPTPGPPPEAVAPLRSCEVAVDYDDDVDGIVDRWSVLRYDDLGQWIRQDLDDGSYQGHFTAIWKAGCRVREEGALVDDEGTEWTITATQDCESHRFVTRRTEVWSGAMTNGASMVYGDTTRWTWTWDGDRYVAVAWTSNDGETTHVQTWSWSHNLGPDSAEVDLISDGVVDERWAWSWDADGDVTLEQQDDRVTHHRRDIRDRLIETEVEGESLTRFSFSRLLDDRVDSAEDQDIDGELFALRSYDWSCPVSR